jgi:hypothetical protein
MSRATPTEDWTLALSVSESPDLDVLGLFKGDDTRVLNSLLTPLVYRGARIAYGGRIEPHSSTNYTLEISTQLAEAYRQSGSDPMTRPYIHYLRDNDARREGVESLFAHALRLGSYSEIKLLRDELTVATLLPSGGIVDVRANGARLGAVKTAEELKRLSPVAGIFSDERAEDEETRKQKLAYMRSAMAKETDARIIMGGRMTRVTGGTSGIAAEALATLEAKKPLLIIGGIGGASRDVALVLELLDKKEQVERDDSVYSDANDAPAKDRYRSHIEKLLDFGPEYRSMLEQRNLLKLAERLAVSDSYAEIGSLVVTMLNTLLRQKNTDPQRQM